MRFSLLRFENIGISLCEFASINDHWSLFYLGWDPIYGIGFSILWLKKHGLDFNPGLRILDGSYEPFEKNILNRFKLRLFL